MKFFINNLEISYHKRPLLIAEIGINHGGDLRVAKSMAKLAIESGADIIKHQTHILEDEMSDEAAQFKIAYLNQSIYDIMKSNTLSTEEEVIFKDYVENDLKSIYISTPFSRAVANFLFNEKVNCFKIGLGNVIIYLF